MAKTCTVIFINVSIMQILFPFHDMKVLYDIVKLYNRKVNKYIENILFLEKSFLLF